MEQNTLIDLCAEADMNIELIFFSLNSSICFDTHNVLHHYRVQFILIQTRSAFELLTERKKNQFYIEENGLMVRFTLSAYSIHTHASLKIIVLQ